MSSKKAKGSLPKDLRPIHDKLMEYSHYGYSEVIGPYIVKMCKVNLIDTISNLNSFIQTNYIEYNKYVTASFQSYSIAISDPPNKTMDDSTYNGTINTHRWINFQNAYYYTAITMIRNGHHHIEISSKRRK